MAELGVVVESIDDWYQRLIDDAELATYSDVRGCMILLPYGLQIWSKIRELLTAEFNKNNVHEVYFPTLISAEIYQKHMGNYECFHAGLPDNISDTHTESLYVIRPTSEVVFGKYFSSIALSYRDLPMLYNQWCNVFRPEMRTRFFLRTTEILWQEGHGVHETFEDADRFIFTIHKSYEKVLLGDLLLCGCSGEKPSFDRFPGSSKTLTVECMMQDGKALQSATSHVLGQHYSKKLNILFQNRSGEKELAFTSSWGTSTRDVGAVILTHGDSSGINLPTAIAPFHFVIIPVGFSEDVVNYCMKIYENLLKKCRVFLDLNQHHTFSAKKWTYIKKGVPYIILIGAKETNSNSVFVVSRSDNLYENTLSLSEFDVKISSLLDEHDSRLKAKAQDYFKKNTNSFTSCAELLSYFKEGGKGFALGYCYDSDEVVASHLVNTALSVRCLLTPGNSGEEGKCIFSGVKTNKLAVFAKSY
ncbi:proline--tRNA ligase [Alphaproteobacteria bacterium]|nr:proline--tRNA ligase [Alphaproteobacteria bacterium]